MLLSVSLLCQYPLFPSVICMSLFLLFPFVTHVWLFRSFSSHNTYIIILICRDFPFFFHNAMRRSRSCDFLNEAHHLSSQIDIINGRALELDNLISYVQGWLNVFRADVDFAESRIGEIERSIATCETLSDRARKNTLSISDPNISLLFLKYLRLPVSQSRPRIRW